MTPDDVTLKEHLTQRIDAVDDRIDELDKRLAVILAMNDRAVSKAEGELNRRLNGMNEFREQLTRQEKEYLKRDDYDRQHTAMRVQIDGMIPKVVLEKYEAVMGARFDAMCTTMRSLEISRANIEGKASQSSVWIAYIIAGIGIALNIIGLLDKLK
jgi:hypothetical protein